MKKIILSLAFCLFIACAFSQTVKVPDFAQPEVKTFYTDYSNFLIKCVKTIHEKNEAGFAALINDPGKQLYAKRLIIEKKVIMNPVEKQKWMQYSAQVYPIAKEVKESAYYKKYVKE